VVATANDVQQLPPELLRKGRLDEIFYVDLPSEEEREEIFRIHLAKRGRDPRNFDLPALTATSRDFSGAEIEEAIISALYDAFYAKQELATAHVLESLAQTVPMAKTMSERISAQRNWANGRARNASVARPPTLAGDNASKIEV
jgi:SpoVK/Ycf46/Vps4 family AAA+-type ATPase